jgi:hypothetical protein
LPNSVAAVPAVITDSDVEQVASMTLEFRKLDQRYGGGAAVDAARGFYGYARRMIHSTADQRTHRDLKVSLADFSSMLGWSFHDIGDQAAARRFLMNALVLRPGRHHTVLLADPPPHSRIGPSHQRHHRPPQPPRHRQGPCAPAGHSQIGRQRTVAPIQVVVRTGSEEGCGCRIRRVVCCGLVDCGIQQFGEGERLAAGGRRQMRQEPGADQRVVGRAVRHQVGRKASG